MIIKNYSQFNLRKMAIILLNRTINIKCFIELTFASKLCVELYPNSLQKALENHPTDLTDKAKAVLDFLKSKNIDGNVALGL